MPKVIFATDDHMIETFPPDGTDEPLYKPVCHGERGAIGPSRRCCQTKPKSLHWYWAGLHSDGALAVRLNPNHQEVVAQRPSKQ